MKEVYDIIIAKLIQDKKRCNEEISDIIDEVEHNRIKHDSYERLTGKIRYISELIEFFEDASRFLD